MSFRKCPGVIPNRIFFVEILFKIPYFATEYFRYILQKAKQKDTFPEYYKGEENNTLPFIFDYNSASHFSVGVILKESLH